MSSTISTLLQRGPDGRDEAFPIIITVFKVQTMVQLQPGWPFRVEEILVAAVYREYRQQQRTLNEVMQQCWAENVDGKGCNVDAVWPAVTGFVEECGDSGVDMGFFSDDEEEEVGWEDHGYGYDSESSGEGEEDEEYGDEEEAATATALSPCRARMVHIPYPCPPPTPPPSPTPPPCPSAPPPTPERDPPPPSHFSSTNTRITSPREAVLAIFELIMSTPNTFLSLTHSLSSITGIPLLTLLNSPATQWQNLPEVPEWIRHGLWASMVALRYMEYIGCDELASEDEYFGTFYRMVGDGLKGLFEGGYEWVDDRGGERMEVRVMAEAAGGLFEGGVGDEEEMEGEGREDGGVRWVVAWEVKEFLWGEFFGLGVV